MDKEYIEVIKKLDKKMDKVLVFIGGDEETKQEGMSQNFNKLATAFEQHTKDDSVNFAKARGAIWAVGAICVIIPIILLMFS